jgi:hypothetical protein
MEDFHDQPTMTSTDVVDRPQVKGCAATDKIESMADILAKLRDIYFHELGFQCTAVRDNCEQAFSFQPLDTGERTFIVMPAKLAVPIGGALSAAANVKKLIDDKRKRNKKFESENAYRLRLARAHMLLTELDGIPLDEILKLEVRNSLEHFDEYLDRENIRLQDISTPCVALYNVGLSHEGNVVFEEGPLLDIRTYVASTKEFRNLGLSINLGRLCAEAVAILSRLIENKRIPADGTTGVMSFVNFPEPPSPES